VSIPTIQPLWGKAKPDDMGCSLVEGNTARSHLDDLRATMGIEQIGATELVQVRLAVITVANDAIDVAGRDAAQ